MEFKQNPNSNQWVAFPKSYMESIQEVFQTQFKQHLKDCKIFSEGRIYTSEICLRIGYLEKNHTHRPITLEASLPYSSKESVNQSILFLVDALEIFANHHFEKKSLEELPRDWTETEVLEKKVYFRLSTENIPLEKEADKLLGETEDSFIKKSDTESSDTESAELSDILKKINLD